MSERREPEVATAVSLDVPIFLEVTPLLMVKIVTDLMFIGPCMIVIFEE